MQDTNGGYVAGKDLDMPPAAKRKSILSVLSVWPFVNM